MNMTAFGLSANCVAEESGFLAKNADMVSRIFRVAILTMAIAAFAVGCKKNEAEPSAKQKSIPTEAAPLVHIHWLGKNHIAADTNAANFLRIWNLTETAKLQSQTLDKLAIFLAHSGRVSTNAATNEISALLRPLLDDLVQYETYFDARDATNSVLEFLVAVKLPDERAGIWETNIEHVLQSRAEFMPMAATNSPRHWIIKDDPHPHHVELARAGEWTLLTISRGSNSQTALALDRISHGGGPFESLTTNHWLEAELDLSRIAHLAGLDGLPSNSIPRVNFTALGDAQGVMIRGTLKFASPPIDALPAWNIPTNLIHDPLTSFTAARGVSAWLSSIPIWRALDLGDAPNQLFTWSQGAFPLLTFGAAPSRDASNQVQTIARKLLQDVNPRLESNSMVLGYFTNMPDATGVSLTGAPFILPFLKLEKFSEGDFLYGGLFTSPPTNQSMPAELLYQLGPNTNIVYYEWELTGPRVEAWIYTGQLLRLTLKKPQIPPFSAALGWLRTVPKKFANSTTAITRVSPVEYSFVRRGDVGFTALELHLLADWLESPTFPFGLYSSVAQPPKRAARPSSQPNSPIAPAPPSAK